MIDRRIKIWPNAVQTLSEKNSVKQSVTLWHLDNELAFTVKSVKPTSTGHRIELSAEGISAVIETTDGTDEVSISFYSKG